PPTPPLFPYTTLFRSPGIVSDVVGDLAVRPGRGEAELVVERAHEREVIRSVDGPPQVGVVAAVGNDLARREQRGPFDEQRSDMRSEEHTSELQSLTNI